MCCAHRIPDSLEQSPGALVALNDDNDELNLATETIYVGPEQRPVTVLKRVPDNQPDRIPELGRQHHIAAQWDLTWSVDDDGISWEGSVDDDVRPAIVTSTVAGSVTFDSPENTQLWVPAWALYGPYAIDGNRGAVGCRLTLDSRS